MIIMLNGTFGAGKTSVAEELVRTIPNSMLYDPEGVGYMLRYMTKDVCSPEEDTGDFQDLALWPTLVVVTAQHLYWQYGRNLIVPMTLANLTYLATIRQGLEQIAPPLHHFCLVAPLGTLQERLNSRPEDMIWALEKAEEYADLFYDPAYGVHINTEGESAADVAAHIIAITTPIKIAITGQQASGDKRVGVSPNA